MLIMPGEHVCAYEMRSTVVGTGKLLASYVNKLSVKRESEIDCDYWRLLPTSCEGAFLKKIEGNHYLIDSIGMAKEHTHLIECGGDKHEMSIIGGWRLYIRDQWEGGNKAGNVSLRRAHQVVRSPISYCPKCVQKQVEDHGFMWFLKEPCSISGGDHKNIYFIGCPRCHVKYRASSAAARIPIPKKRRRLPPEHSSLLQNRLRSVMIGSCKECNLNIWDNIIGFEERLLEIRDEEERKVFEDLFQDEGQVLSAV